MIDYRILFAAFLLALVVVGCGNGNEPQLQHCLDFLNGVGGGRIELGGGDTSIVGAPSAETVPGPSPTSSDYEGPSFTETISCPHAGPEMCPEWIYPDPHPAGIQVDCWEGQTARVTLSPGCTCVDHECVCTACPSVSIESLCNVAELLDVAEDEPPHCSGESLPAKCYERLEWTTGDVTGTTHHIDHEFIESEECLQLKLDGVKAVRACQENRERVLRECREALR